jgi:hypothetical protein
MEIFTPMVKDISLYKEMANNIINPGNIRTAIRYYPDGYPDKSEGPVGWLKII